QAAPHHDVVPLGLLDAVAVLARVALRGGDREVRDLHAGRNRAHVRIFSEVADEHDFVEGCHCTVLFFPAFAGTSPPTFAGGHWLMMIPHAGPSTTPRQARGKTQGPAEHAEDGRNPITFSGNRRPPWRPNIL